MASALDTLAQLLGSIGPVGTGLALAAVPAVGAAAAYITRMGSQARIDRLEGDLKRIEERGREEAALAARRYAELEDRYQGMLRTGALIQTQLDAIIGEASDAMLRLDAADYSVLVPAPTAIPGDVPDQLVFLCASGPQFAKLRWVRVPIATSLSGQVFASGKNTIASPSSGAFAARTDKITDYRTDEALSVCLRYRGGHVGVAQFLNKRSGRFSSEDMERAQDLCAALAIRVGDFLADPRRILEMGHAPRRDQHRAAIMFVDLTRYDDLFRMMESSVITDVLNQYFQDLCDIAIRHGATVDQFIGDGFLLIFGADRCREAHEAAALAAAREMRTAFQALRQRWVTLGYAATEALFVRFGISSGLVTRAEVGHAQSRRVTVIGTAVNAAGHVCQDAPRDRDTICLTQALRDAVMPDAPQVRTRTGTVYEVPP